MQIRALMLALACLVSVASADEQDAVRRAVEAGSIRPLAEILAAVQAKYPGRVLDVDLERWRDGRQVYEIELLTPDRRTLEVHVDARTGQILERGGSGARASEGLSALLRELLQRYPGHVVDIELDGGRYEIEIVLLDGASVQVAIDAETGKEVSDGRAMRRLEDILPLPDVLDLIGQRYPGSVLEVELERGRDGRMVYEFDIRDERGREIELHVDAHTGDVLAEDRG